VQLSGDIDEHRAVWYDRNTSEWDNGDFGAGADYDRLF
jgi:hypothetical protein